MKTNFLDGNEKQSNWHTLVYSRKRILYLHDLYLKAQLKPMELYPHIRDNFSAEETYLLNHT